MASAHKTGAFDAAETGENPKPLSDIDAETYAARVRVFIRARGRTHLIVKDAGHAPAGFSAAPLSWVCWLAYFHSKGIPQITIERNGYGTVPCEWPYQFDSDWLRARDDIIVHRAKAAPREPSEEEPVDPLSRQ
jgi:hypothetical protein